MANRVQGIDTQRKANSWAEAWLSDVRVGSLRPLAQHCLSQAFCGISSLNTRRGTQEAVLLLFLLY